ncbi:L domain-like protein [Testicularia cyperi]|uniref:L domain-like protein n=1 Tax=Testicularia cyperi TaxID=1882483 RepID=A0A317XVF4_9BASI|nr:L domain-like protein [Testicularia cyperi]
MDSINGDQWVADYARWIRVHEAKLGDAGRRALTQAPKPPSSASSASQPASGLSSTFWSVVSLGTITSASGHTVPAATAAASQAGLRPMLLRQNPHNLYYLLIRFEALGLPVGPLDVKIPAAARPTSYFSFVSTNTISADKDDTMSLSSIRSRMSVVSSSFSVASWFGSTAPKYDPTTDLRYLYACLTKIPSLRIGPIPSRKLIQDFEDCPGQSAVPMDVFKNLQLLELDDVDPRTLIGWDRLSIQLRSLTCKRSTIEDISDLLIDLVVTDVRRRRGDKASTFDTDHERSTDGHGVEVPSQQISRSATPAPITGEKEPGSATPKLPADLPSIAWHFLRYLNLSCNNLTFVPVEPLSCLSGLTHLDLSSNLLNVVPPSLSHLPSLTSLNISDNLIDSVLGIYDTLPAIRVLNLSKNRLESLCGLERLFTLERIDLRTNCIYEAGEVGRLATLPGIREVYVKDNPLVDELLDYRVDCFVEFASEGRAVLLDGEAPGFFEKQRITERVPNAEALLAASTAAATNRAKGNSNTGEEEQEAKLAQNAATSRNATVVRNVRHRNHSHAVGQTGGGGSPSSASRSRSRGDVSASHLSSNANHTSSNVGAKRRNQRIVDLDRSPTKPSGKDDTTMTDSDRIKQAALAGDTTGAMESPDAKRATTQTQDSPQTALTSAPTLTTGREAPNAFAAHSAMLFALPSGASAGEGQQQGEGISPSKQRTWTSRNIQGTSTLGRNAGRTARPSAAGLFGGSPTKSTVSGNDGIAIARQRIARPGTGSSAALARRSRVTASLYDPDMSSVSVTDVAGSGAGSGHGREGGGSAETAPSAPTAAGALGAGMRSEAFRRRIEALKNEVGDDWLRLLARGGGPMAVDSGPGTENHDDGNTNTNSNSASNGNGHGNGHSHGHGHDHGNGNGNPTDSLPSTPLKQVRPKKSKKRLAASGMTQTSSAGTGAGLSGITGRVREAKIT